MNTERFCYLHVGTGKTGTTAVQYALAVSRRRLLVQGMEFPNLTGNMRQMLRGVPTCGNGQRLFACLDRNDRRGALNVLDSYIPAAPNFVISSEGLGWLPPGKLSWLAERIRERGFQPKCCVVFRPQADYLASAYLQIVKSAKVDWRVSMDEYAQKVIDNGFLETSYNWLAMADQLAAIFGERDTTVLWYPQLAARGRNGVVSGVFKWLGVAMPKIPGMAPFVNPSPNREVAQVLRMLNSMGLGGKEFADALLVHAERRGLLDGKYTLTPVIAQRIDALTQSSNREMLRKYTGLEPEVQVSKPLPETEAGSLREEVVAELLALAARLLRARIGATEAELPLGKIATG